MVDGAYPRLNAAMMATGKYDGEIVSLVGKFSPSGNDHFVCCDQGTIQLDLQHANLSHVPQEIVVEVVGQVTSNTLLALFVVRELSHDMHLETYDRMLEVQHNPKFAHYFAASAN